MGWLKTAFSQLRTDPKLILQALRTWGPRQYFFAALASVGMAILIGVPTVLIPNPIFGREIPPVWWNYPVWILTSVLSGMLVATYLRPESVPTNDQSSVDVVAHDGTAQQSSRLGVIGTALAWFAVGCPVCNKFALLALGSSGAMTWFAPVQPFIALLALGVTGVALMVRLQGQVACRLPARHSVVA